MKRFLDLPISTKLFVLMLFSNCTALFLTLVAVVVYDVISHENSALEDLKSQSEMLEQSSMAPLIFNDKNLASAYLSTLKIKPYIGAAALYQPDGKIIATFSKDGVTRDFPKLENEGQRIEDGHVIHFDAIEKNGKTLGAMYMSAELNSVRRALRFSGIVLLMMAASLGAVILISRKLQKIVTGPILEISSVARTVIEKKDYTLRAHQYYNDELGSFVLAFNQMLAHIQEWHIELNNVNNALRKEIDGRREAQIALNANVQELARSNLELEQFAYVSSHDLQEPLRMVASYTQLLESRYADKFDDKGRLFLFHIVDGAKRMQQLIDDLLMYSRVGTRHRELTPIDSQQPLKIALLNLKKTIEENNTMITSSQLPTVMADPIQLVQLFQNLISNAIKFKGTSPPHIDISANKLNEFWQYAVRDNGIGIEKDYFDRIFIVFQRLHGRTEYAGTGIGLAICKKIVEFHGGRIWVESEPGKGTTFYFTLRGAS